MGGVRVVVVIPCTSVGYLVVCDDPDGVFGVTLPLFTALAPTDAFRRNLVALRARDRAENLSAAATLLVVIDEKLPSAPTPTNAFCEPRALCVDNVYRARTLNADAFTLRLPKQPNQIDRNFSEYRVAKTVGDDLTVPPAIAFEATARVDNIVQGRPSFGDVAVYGVNTDGTILLTGVDGDEWPRSNVDVSGARVTWVDGQLGDFDVWESVQRSRPGRRHAPRV